MVRKGQKRRQHGTDADLQLLMLCQEGRWEEVRKWITKHSDDEPTLKASALARTEVGGKNSLHNVLGHQDGKSPPEDIVRGLVGASSQVVRKRDSLGRTPLHYATNASVEVLKIITDEYPESLDATDDVGATPLHTAAERQASVEVLKFLVKDRPARLKVVDDQGRTPLQCSVERNSTSTKVVKYLASTGAASIKDINGMLPIHIAVDRGPDLASSFDVIEILVSKYPSGLTARDDTGKTALHYAIECPSNSPKLISLLASKGSWRIQDEQGMLPIHIACETQRNRPVETLEALVDRDVVFHQDSKGRTPIHLAMANADSVDFVSFLMRHPGIINSPDINGRLPLDHLSERANHLKNTQREERECVETILRIYLKKYLEFRPDGTKPFISALQALPRFVRKTALRSPGVQRVLSVRLSMRFPVMILLLDLYSILTLIIFFRLAIHEMIDILFDAPNAPAKVNSLYLFPLHLGNSYFGMREGLQLIKALRQNSFKTWLLSAKNMLDVSCICLVFFWTIVMTVGEIPNPDIFRDVFRVGTTLSTGMLFLLLLSFLRSTSLKFAVFIDGVLYVVKNLPPFLICLAVFLFAFAQMFYTAFQGTCFCQEIPNQVCPMKTGEVPFCNLWTTLLQVYAILLGKVEEDDFVQGALAASLFSIFTMLGVILLANVLIAIVTDAFSIIKDQRAQLVFFSNRLSFLADVDWFLPNSVAEDQYLISFKNESRHMVPLSESNKSGYWSWQYLCDVFSYRSKPTCLPHLLQQLIPQRIIALLLMSIWVVVGFCTAGFLFPPQVRSLLIMQRTDLTTDFDDEDEFEQQQEEKNATKSAIEELGLLKKMNAIQKDVNAKVIRLERKMDARLNNMEIDIKEIKRMFEELTRKQSSSSESPGQANLFEL